MADLTAATYEQITTVLSKLATNYSNLAVNFFDIFYNTVPMDVTVQMYDEAGVLQTYVIPNRAKDRNYILNGEGSPEGVYDAAEGSIYQDIENGNVYVKKTLSGSEGWDCLLSQSVLDEILIQGLGNPEGAVVADTGVLYIDKAAASLYIKTGGSSTTGWVLISSDTTSLANRDLSNLTNAGFARFANPSLNNLSTAGEARLDEKEDKINKVVNISSASTDVQYPSAKAVKTFVNNETSTLANVNFSNITDTAVLTFLGQKQVRDCVLSTPNGALSITAGNNVVFHEGTIVLCANGKTADGRLNNVQVETTVDWPGVVPQTANAKGKVFYDDTNKKLWCVTLEKFYNQTSTPTAVSGDVWYNPSTNRYRYVKVESGTNSWDDALMVEVGNFVTNTTGTLATLTPENPITITPTSYMNETIKSTVDSSIINVLKTIYPVGSIYIGVNSTCPLASLFGTWTKKASGRVLQGADSGHAAGTTIAAGLPNITGTLTNCYRGTAAGVFKYDGESSNGGDDHTALHMSFDASRSSSIYGANTTVQPPAYVVNIWERTA